MKKLFFIFVLATLILISSNFVSACIGLPKIETKRGCNLFYEGHLYINEEGQERLDWKNETHMLNFLEAEKNRCGFNENDIEIIKDFIINGYSVKEQTDNEYNDFFEMAEKANEGRPENCLAYLAVYRNSSWTGYIKTGYAYGGDDSCAAMSCSGVSANVLWNELEYIPPPGDTGIGAQSYTFYYILAIIIIILSILFFAIKLRKK